MEEKTNAIEANELHAISTQTPSKKPNYLLIILIFILALIFIFSIVFYVNSLSKTNPPVEKKEIQSPKAELSIITTTPSQQEPKETIKKSSGEFKAKAGDNSMSPLISNGDEVNIDLFFEGTLTRGDIVLVRAESILRIIGLPGEEIMIKNGSIYINEVKLNEAYLQKGIKTAAGNFLKEGIPAKIPAEEYIVLGDNRKNSQDSRDIGFIKTSDITGIVKLN